MVVRLNLIDGIGGIILDVIHSFDPLAAPVNQKESFSSVRATVRPDDWCVAFAGLQGYWGVDLARWVQKSHSQAMLEERVVVRAVHADERSLPCLEEAAPPLLVWAMLLSGSYWMLAAAFSGHLDWGVCSRQTELGKP